MQKIITGIGLLVLTGCATIVDGRPDNISMMTSNGRPAKVQIISNSGVQTVELASVVTVPKSCKDITVQVVEDNKHEQSMYVVSSGVNGWILGNILLGGFIGLGIDAITGAMCTYPSNVFIPVTDKR